MLISFHLTQMERKLKGLFTGIGGGSSRKGPRQKNKVSAYLQKTIPMYQEEEYFKARTEHLN